MPSKVTSANISKIDALLEAILSTSALGLTYNVAHQPDQFPSLIVTFSGADVSALLHRNAELLLALEHLATQTLNLEPDQHDQISFDAAGFKQARIRTLQLSAERAIHLVRASRKSFAFPPMTSRERRLLHLALATSGLPTASEGEGSRRHLVLHPKP